MSSVPYRGLHKFIHELRQLQTKEEERRRVNKEMANIRSKFRDSKKLSSYDRRKYVCKLMYMFILDYDVEWGLKEVINLIASPKFADKQIGYLAASLLFPNHPSLLLSLFSSLKSDLNSSDSRIQNLALTLSASFPSADLNDVLGTQIHALIRDPSTPVSVRSRAIFTLRSLLVSNTDSYQASDLSSLLTSIFQSETSPSVLHAAVLLLQSCLSLKLLTNPSSLSTISIELVNIVVQCHNQHYSQTYRYHGLVAPWLLIHSLQTLRLLQIPSDRSTSLRLVKVLSEILNCTDVPKGVSKNCSYAILYESMCLALTFPSDLIDECTRAVTVVGKFIASTHPNLKFMGLRACSTFSHSPPIHHLLTLPEQQESLQGTIREVDLSLRKMGVAVMFDTADEQNSKQVVGQLLDLLTESIQTVDGVETDLPSFLKEEIVLRVAILAESCAHSQSEQLWYIDSLFTLITQGGDAVIDALWYRVVHFITNNESVQKYSFDKSYSALVSYQDAYYVPSPLLRLCIYVLGEFCSSSSVETIEVFRLLKMHYNNLEPTDSLSKSLFLTAFSKLSVVDKTGVYPEVIKLLTNLSRVFDTEVQQRALEYLTLLTTLDDESLLAVLDAIPEFSSETNPLNSLLSKRDQKSESRGVKEGKDGVSTRVERSEPVVSTPQAPVEDQDMMEAQKSPQKSEENDLMDLLELDTSPVHSNLIEDQQDKLLNAIMSEKAVLFEDSTIQIGVRHEYRGSSGRLVLFLGNKTSVDFSNVTFTLNSEISNLNIQFSSISSVIPAKSQVQVKVLVTCSGVFNQVPKFLLKFNNISMCLSFPFTISKFSIPLDQSIISDGNPQSFFDHWNNLTNQKQLMFDFENFDSTKISNYFNGLGYRILKGIDNNPNNFLIAQSFLEKSSVVARLEFNQQVKKGRITARGGIVTDAFVDFIVSLFV
ncbi:hypothetical protein RCL1_001529 [Eukaryota sp. TZLM3-RCL]